MQIVQLPRRRGRKTRSIFYLVAKRFSREGLRHFDRCTFRANCRGDRYLGGCVQRALHGLPFAFSSSNPNSSCVRRPWRRRGLLRKLSRSRGPMVTRSYSNRLDLRYASQRRPARFAKSLRTGQCLRRLSSKYRQRSDKSRTSHFDV